MHIQRRVSPDATTDYKRPFSVTENLSRYQNVEHHVMVCMLTVASRTRTSWQQQSYKFQGDFGLERALGPCSCFFAPEVECGWLHFTSVNFSSQELKSQIGMAYWWKTSVFLCRYGWQPWRFIAGGLSKCSVSKYQSCGVTNKHSLTSRLKMFAPLACQEGDLHTEDMLKVYFFCIREEKGTKRSLKRFG